MNDVTQEYKKIEKVGRGTYGTVFKVKNLKDHKYYAIKKLENKDPKLQAEGFPITALREIMLLKQIQHPNIITLKEIILSKPCKRNLMRGSTSLVFDYMDHDFTGLFRGKVFFTLPEIKCIIYQLLQGVAHLHKNKIMHRDIKPANILLNDQGDVKLADFGLGRKLRLDNVYTYKVVTLWYRAPQLLLGCRNYTTKVDMWSIGCVIAQFFIKQILFRKDTQYAQLQKIFEVCGGIQQNQFSQQIIKNCSYYTDFKPKIHYPINLITYLKKINPNIDKQTLNFLQKFLQLNPQKRINCQDALNHHYFINKPYPCKKEQIQKMDHQFHQMYKDNSIQIERKQPTIINQFRENKIKTNKNTVHKYYDHSANKYPEKNDKSHINRYYDKFKRQDIKEDYRLKKQYSYNNMNKDRYNWNNKYDTYKKYDKRDDKIDRYDKIEKYTKNDHRNMIIDSRNSNKFNKDDYKTKYINYKQDSGIFNRDHRLYNNNNKQSKQYKNYQQSHQYRNNRNDIKHIKNNNNNNNKYNKLGQDLRNKQYQDKQYRSPSYQRIRKNNNRIRYRQQNPHKIQVIFRGRQSDSISSSSSRSRSLRKNYNRYSSEDSSSSNGRSSTHRQSSHHIEDSSYNSNSSKSQISKYNDDHYQHKWHHDEGYSINYKYDYKGVNRRINYQNKFNGSSPITPVRRKSYTPAANKMDFEN